MSDAAKRRRELARSLFGDDVGCHDGGCIYGHPGGMATNGGCQCLKREPTELRRHIHRLVRMVDHAQNWSPPAPITPTWTALIPRAIPSANARLVNQGPTRHAYKKVRDEWTLWLMTATFERVVDHHLVTCLGNAPTLKATGPRRVHFERRFGGRAKLMDHGNMVGGMKPIVDAMVNLGLLVDDDPAHASITYAQTPLGKDGYFDPSLLIRIGEGLA